MEQNMDRCKSKKTLSAVEQVIKEIKNMIIENGLRVGDKIPNEFELSTMFGKSRGCIREAVKILDAYGVLEVRRGDGTYVRGSASAGLFDAQFFKIIAMGTNLSDLIQLRLILETGIIRAVIDRISDEEVEELRIVENKLHEAVASRAPLEQIVAADLNFHTMLVEITGNEVLKNVYINMLDIFTPYIQNSYVQQSAKSDFSVLKHHDLILRAVEERDYDLAVYAIRNSLKDWENLNLIYEPKKLNNYP
ncbi:MAG: FadR family transcriptional regulator [Clostridiaceae bacterium]|nr:FadR family transcriptional regulator [Clostridiaceae bacterium]